MGMGRQRRRHSHLHCHNNNLDAYSSIASCRFYVFLHTIKHKGIEKFSRFVYRYILLAPMYGYLNKEFGERTFSPFSPNLVSEQSTLSFWSSARQHDFFFRIIMQPTFHSWKCVTTAIIISDRATKLSKQTPKLEEYWQCYEYVICNRLDPLLGQ